MHMNTHRDFIQLSIGSTSFAETPFTTNKMCTMIFKKVKFRPVKLEAHAWSDNRALSIFNTITDSSTMHD